FLPLAHAVELIRQAAAGMGYFHARRDDRGRSLEIVHSDISPTNLLVTEDGFLKIIDFGIARAKNQRFRDASAIPGKLSYMAPEQARREPSDYRADIFSLGVVLYEITVGRRLFKGPAHEVVKRLTACDIKPPTFVRRDFPGALEGIIMRALEAHPIERYQSAYDLADELEDFLREQGLKSGPVRIARYVDELIAAAGGERRPELISEAEQARGDEDALDFDRGMFEGYQATAGVEAPGASEWDEYEESEREVAAALGIDPDLLDPATRTPIPSPLVNRPPAQDARAAHEDSAPPRARDEDDDDEDGDAAGPGGEPSPAQTAPASARPRSAPDDSSARAKPAAKPAAQPARAEPARGLPWIPIGAGVAAGVAGIVYLLLS
ncbi:MAG TPA: serine/threonine-protein kinase, partial [Kofleriaceae bacterium]|nr:serine/threonine-protein kinase [Kofleriaceae bacterium]